MKKYYFMKLTWYRVASTRNLLFGWRQDNNETWIKKWVSLVLSKVYENYPNIKEKCYFTKLTSERVRSTENLIFGPLDKIITKFTQKKK